MPAVALLKLSEVARLLRRSPRSIQRYMARGIFPPPVRLGRWPVWRAADIERLVKEGGFGPESGRREVPDGR